MTSVLDVIYPAQDKMVVNSVFNNLHWRKILNDVCKEIDADNLGLEAISPWGFELLGDKNYLSKQLRRFYCYIGVPKISKFKQEDILNSYADGLFKKLQLFYGSFLDDVVVLIKQDNVQKLRDDHYICKPTDKLVDIQLRAVDEDILTDYAKYIVLTLDSIASGKGEASDYTHNKITRWRLYQLYIMQEKLFGHLLEPLNTEQLKAFRSVFILIENMIQVFYSSHLGVGKMNPWEAYIFDVLIRDRIEKMKSAVLAKDKNSNITVDCCSYHIDADLQLTIDSEIYKQALLKVKQTYLGYV